MPEPDLREERRDKRIATVISDRIQMIALDTASVQGLPDAGKPDGQAKRGVKKPVKRVKVSIKNRSIFVNIYIVVDFGKSIPDIARQIQNEAKDFIGRVFPSFYLAAVNIWVVGVRFTTESASYRRAAVDALLLGGTSQDEAAYDS